MCVCVCTSRRGKYGQHGQRVECGYISQMEGYLLPSKIYPKRRDVKTLHLSWAINPKQIYATRYGQYNQNIGIPPDSSNISYVEENDLTWEVAPNKGIQPGMANIYRRQCYQLTWAIYPRLRQPLTRALPRWTQKSMCSGSPPPVTVLDSSTVIVLRPPRTKMAGHSIAKLLARSVTAFKFVSSKPFKSEVWFIFHFSLLPSEITWPI